MNIRTGLLLLLGLVCAGLLISTVRPVETVKMEIPLDIQQSDMRFVRNVFLILPAYLRSGEGGRVQVRLLPAGDEGNGPAYPLQARLEIPGIPTDEQTIISSIHPQTSSSFSWEVQSNTQGKLTGKLWLWVGDEKDHQLVMAAPFELECVYPLGMPTWLARLTSAGGCLFFLAVTWGLTGRRRQEA